MYSAYVSTEADKSIVILFIGTSTLVKAHLMQL